MSKHHCPECGESIVKRPCAASGWTLAVDPKRLAWSHADRTPLCPVMTPTGYQPALPA